MSATAIPSLSGIKQDNLPSSDDLLHAKLKISQPGEYPEDYTPAKDSYACLVLAPYRDFLQSLTAHPCPVTTDNGGCSEEGPAGTGSGLGTTLASLLGLSNRDLSLIEQITYPASSSSSAAPNVLTNCRVTGLRPLENCQQKSLSACRFVDLTSTVTTVAGGKDKDTDKDFTILFAPFSSPALTVDPFFLDQTEYDASLQLPWLQIGAQVRDAGPPQWRPTTATAWPSRMPREEKEEERWNACGWKAKCTLYAATSLVTPISLCLWCGCRKISRTRRGPGSMRTLRPTTYVLHGTAAKQIRAP